MSWAKPAVVKTSTDGQYWEALVMLDRLRGDPRCPKDIVEQCNTLQALIELEILRTPLFKVKRNIQGWVNGPPGILPRIIEFPPTDIFWGDYDKAELASWLRSENLALEFCWRDTGNNDDLEVVVIHRYDEAPWDGEYSCWSHDLSGVNPDKWY